MRLADAEKIARNPNTQWFYTQAGIAKMLGMTRQFAGRFLKSKSVTPHLVEGTIMYFLPDVLEAIESGKWKKQ